MADSTVSSFLILFSVTFVSQIPQRRLLLIYTKI